MVSLFNADFSRNVFEDLTHSLTGALLDITQDDAGAPAPQTVEIGCGSPEDTSIPPFDFEARAGEEAAATSTRVFEGLANE